MHTHEVPATEAGRAHSLTQPLRSEHRTLLPRVEQLRAAADLVGEAPLGELRRALDEAHRFVSHELLPHAQAEERALYPVVARLMGAPSATATMSRDHLEVGRLLEQLTRARSALGIAPPSIPEQKELRRLLYGLHALLKLHFAKEEEIYLPILEAGLTSDAASEMFASMHREAETARQALRLRTSS